MLRNTLAASALLLAMASVNAATVTQWNFNSNPPDITTNTGTILPAIGLGSVSLVGGVTSPSFNSGVGSSDLATDNSGWQTTTYGAQGSGDKTRGVQFAVSTVGFTNVSISYDLRHSNTSSRYEQVQYSVNGTSFTDIAMFDGNAGDTWFNNRSVDLSSIAGVANNASFAFRVVSTFAPTTTTYATSNPGSNYGTGGGTWRFDMVTVSAAPIPEPETYALLLAGLALVGAAARRRNK